MHGETTRMWIRRGGSVIAVLAFLLVAGSTFVAVRGGSKVTANTSAPSDPHHSIAHEHLRRIAEAQARPLIAQLDQRPHDAALLAEIGKVYYTNYDIADAIPYYQKSLAIKDDVNVRNNLGGLYFYSGDSKSATIQFEQVLKVEPANDSARFNLGMVKLQGMNDAAGAAKEWRELLRAHPNHPRRAEVEQWIRSATSGKEQAATR